jgi:NADH:ubiquinone reductase (H+-translocating)
MKLIIIGGGFAGLRLARGLNNRRGFEIILLDRFNFHQFQPLFYQVATAALDASNISFPLRKVFHDSRNVRIRIATLQRVFPAENKILTDIGDMSYDILVLAMGAGTNFFGNAVLEEKAYGMKSTTEALQIRYGLIRNFEDCLRASPADVEKYMTIVVVGGGPTGVELSGAIAEMKRYVLPKDYPELDFSRMKIYLLEGSPRTLATMSEKSSADSRTYLGKLGVTVKTGSIVKEYDGQTVTLLSGEQIRSNTVIWAAGIRGNLPLGIDAEMLAKGNRIRTDRYSMIKGLGQIYVLGDLAYMETPVYPNGHPQVASVAIQQAAMLANNLIRYGANQTRWSEFEYQDKGSMATVGRNLAVVDLVRPKWHLKGFFAWMIWMSLHLMLILGVKNRLFVFLNWLYNYITYDQSLRLLFRDSNRPQEI